MLNQIKRVQVNGRKGEKIMEVGGQRKGVTLDRDIEFLDYLGS